MRRLLLSCVLLASSALVGFAQNRLIEYSANANDTASGVTFRADGVTGAGVSRNGLLPAPGELFSSQGFPNDDFIDFSKYLEFSLYGGGSIFDVGDIEIKFVRSADGPSGLALRWSKNNFASDLTSRVDIPIGSGSLVKSDFAVSDTDTTRSDTLTFRLYGFSAASSEGTLSLNPASGTDLAAAGIFVQGSIDNPFPVELTSFTAISVESGAFVQWGVASELNNDYFSLEVSRDAKNFEEVKQLAGRGTTETEAIYSYDYKAYTSGTYYFRLRQVDFDGTETLSQVVPLNVQGRKGFSVIGNATQSILSLEVEGARDFRIISLTGEVVQSTPSLSGLVDVDVSNLPSGMYLLTDGTTTTRFVR